MLIYITVIYQCISVIVYVRAYEEYIVYLQLLRKGHSVL